jgi:hypothetical protein
MTWSPLDYAEAYTNRGWRVFVLSGSKVPVANCAPCHREHTTPDVMESCTCLMCHGFYAATTDLERVREMLRLQPRGMLAVRTGAVSGLAVVDVDFEKFVGDVPAADDPAYVTMSGLDERQLLPGTLMQSSGSGGLHLLYAHPGGYLMSGARKYGPNVDSKADGGYIVVAPSVSRSGPYAWTPDGRCDHPLTQMPEELAAIVRPKPPEPKPIVSVTPWTRPGSRSRLHALIDTVLTSPSHTRNDRLYWAAKKAGEMVAANEIEESAAVAVLTDAGLAVGLLGNPAQPCTRLCWTVADGAFRLPPRCRGLASAPASPRLGPAGRHVAG